MSDPDAGLIVRLAARGEGVTADGRFVALTAPGDRVDEAGKVVMRGDAYVEPPCRHFPTCGGCQLQHVSDAAYSEFLNDRIKSALAAQGLEAPIFEPSLSPSETRRRVALRAVRQGKSVILGYAEGQSHKLIDLAQCPVMHPELWGMIKPLRALLGAILPPVKTATVRMTLADQGVDLTIAGVEIDGLDAVEALNAFGLTHKLARISVDEGYGASTRWEPVPVTVNLSGISVPLPEGSFLQATVDGEAALCGAITTALGRTTRRADLFAGIGTFTFWTGAAYAAEGARDAALALQSAARSINSSLVVEHRDLFRRPLSTSELNRFDGVVIDPPRAGAKEQAAELAKSNVAAIAYVSCNPSTFARDAKTLVEGGYMLNWVHPVGQFRWSTHAELAASLSR